MLGNQSVSHGRWRVVLVIFIVEVTQRQHTCPCTSCKVIPSTSGSGISVEGKLFKSGISWFNDETSMQVVEYLPKAGERCKFLAVPDPSDQSLIFCEDFGPQL